MEACRDRASSIGVLVPALGVVGQCRMAQLVQGPPCRLPGGGREGCGGVFEHFGRPAVGQSGPAGVGAQVQGGHRPGGGEKSG